jgi:glucose-6-phosphate dehydrogenase assembly protein OpcA
MAAHLIFYLSNTRIMNTTQDIQIVNIEGELARLWESRSEKNQIKACLFTLIIYAPDERRANYLREMIPAIIEKLPCRIFFIQCDKRPGQDYLHVNASYLTSNKGGSPVICEQITIETSQNQLFRVPFILVPHLVPDLPIYLLWGQNPADEKEILPHIQRFASRLIFDSECFDNLQRFSQKMVEEIDSHKMNIMDINWALMSNWRDILYQIFDTPEKIQQLDSSQTIQISYNDSKTEFVQHPEIRSLYLQAWLAAQLKWNFQGMETIDGEHYLIYSNNAHQQVNIKLCPQIQSELPTGAILSIEISTYTGHFYFMSRKPKLAQVLVHTSSQEKCELPYTLSLPSVHLGFAFIKEIFYQSISSHYRNMLQTISRIQCHEFSRVKK